MVYVAFYTTASVKTAQISRELRSALEKAGWQDSPLLNVDSTIFFLEDKVYAAYTEEQSFLINRYTNRNSWSEDTELLFTEAPLLKEGADLSGVEVYTTLINEFETDPGSGIFPDYEWWKPVFCWWLW